MGAGSIRQSIAVLTVLWVILVPLALGAPRLVPSANPDDLVTRQTARVAVLYWALAAAALLVRQRMVGRWCWTLACAAFIVHVAVAFARVHDWSHRQAYTHVEAVSGFGPGIFVSYFFTLLWLADVAWWWSAKRSYDGRSRTVDWSIHGIMAFVVFNGTVVYETGFIRWAGVVVFGGLAILAVRRWQRH